MSVEYIGTCYAGYVWEIRGTSTDTRPTVGPGDSTLGSGSVFRELNTSKVWEYSVANTNPLTTDGWWEVI